MSIPRPDAASALCASAVATVAAGIAIHLHVGVPLGTLPALVLVGLGLTTVTSRVATLPVEHLRRHAVRWWGFAVVGFVPYGLLAPPEPATGGTAGAAGPLAGTALEAAAGALVCCAVAVTVLYGFARYGLYPGRPTPEERVLND